MHTNNKEEKRMNIEDLTLTKSPYLDGTNEDAMYSAHATDKQGNEYMVHWEIKAGYEKWDDEQDKCDWDNPIFITKL
jgi:hypothetical protein